MWVWNGKGKLLDYAEREGKENIAFDIECTNMLEKAGYTLLHILLAGAGGALAMSVSLYEKGSEAWLTAGIFCVSVYLFTLSALLIYRCLWVDDICPPGNDPVNFLKMKYLKSSFQQIRKENIESLQRRIDWNTDRNEKVGIWLNKIRLLCALTPAWLIVCYFIF